MVRKLPSLALLASLVFACFETAVAQWPTDEFLYRLPPTQVPAATETPYIAQGTTVDAPGLNGLRELPAPAGSAALEELPVTEDSGSWILPTYWFNTVDWEGGAEVGISGTNGNSESASFRAGMNLKRKVTIHETTFDLTYVNTQAGGVETQNNAIQNFGYERAFGETRWSFFAKEFAEYDEFKSFDLRIAMNAGIGYTFIDTETTTLKGRYGAGVSHEIGGPNDDWVPELVYGADFKRQLTKRQKLEFKLDYFPEWRNFSNYRMVSSLGWEVLLDEEHNLNLKLSINDRYDSTPNGQKPNDINYALLLLWKI
jgi:putative salt-induced outer membrane protein YdiY